MTQLEREGTQHHWHARSSKTYGRRKESIPFHDTGPTTGFKSVISPEAAKHLERYDALALSIEAQILAEGGVRRSLDTVSFQKFRDLDPLLVEAITIYINSNRPDKSHRSIDSSEITFREFYAGLSTCWRLIVDRKNNFQNLSDILS